MKPLRIAFTTFLKICTKKPRGKIGEVRRFTSGGGYDFYKVMKRIAGQLASGSIGLADAKVEISKIKKPAEREHTLAAITKLHAWLAKNELQWCAPPHGSYRSPSGLLIVRLEPELSFVDNAGSKRVIYLWNLANPELKKELAGEGLWLLADELGRPDNKFEILNLRNSRTYTEDAIGTASGTQLNHDLILIEEIWKSLNNPAHSAVDTLEHISSFKFPPATPPL